VVLCLTASVQAGQANPRAAEIHGNPAPISFPDMEPRTRIDLLLAQGDTVAAIEILQDNSGSGWSDSLLDLLVLPEPFPVPKAPPAPSTRNELGTRLQFGMIPDGADRNWLGIGRVEWSRTTSRGEVVRGFGCGLGILGYRTPDTEYLGIEPTLEGMYRVGRLHASTRGWARFGNQYDPDAGLDIEFLHLVTPSLLAGFVLDLTLESTQEASAVVAKELRTGPVSWTATMLAGWMRMIPLSAHGYHAMEVDSVAFFRTRNGVEFVEEAWSEGTRYGYQVLSDHVDQSSWDIEAVDPDRLRLRTRIQALLGRRLQWGPTLDADLRSSIGEERWLPDARSTWAPGTSFLRIRGTSRVEAYGGKHDSMVVIHAPALVEAMYLSARLSPGMRSLWCSRDLAWQIEGAALWNFVMASDPGHPLEDTRDGLELRLGVGRIW